MEKKGGIFQIITLSPFSHGQQANVYQGDVIISVHASFLLATAWQAVQTGRGGRKMRHLPIE